MVNGLMMAEAPQESNDVFAAVADEVLLACSQEGLGRKGSQKDAGPELIELVLPGDVLSVSSGHFPTALLVLDPHSVVDMPLDIGSSRDDELNIFGNLKLIDFRQDLCFKFLEELG